LPSGSNYPAAEFITCAIRTTLQPAALSGHVVKSLGRLGYVMIHDASSVARAEVESARIAGHEEERARIVRMFHDEVSSTMLAVLFAIESAKELEAQNLPQAETVAKASELLQEVVEKISEVLEDKKDSGQQSSQ
jgi:signal transduction histidine kinase